MGYRARTYLACYLAIFVCLSVGAVTNASEAIIIDHNCIDLYAVPSDWINEAQDAIKLHYGHTSHGSQLVTGLQRIENDDRSFAVAMSTNGLPEIEGALCMYHPSNDPSQYYANTQGILDSNPQMNYSMFGWCCQATDSDWQDILNEYLDRMQAFEAANPDVTFIYMTGNAQATGESGYNRYRFNEQVRQFCLDNNKVLFDFGDLDCWFDGELHSYEYDGTMIPSEHPHFNGSEAGHTTYESCEQKGRAFWWMMARLAGWDPNAQGPYINLHANGEPEFLAISCDETVTVTLNLGDNGYSTPPYEVWIAAETPFGWFSYVYPTGWQPGLARTIDFEEDGMVDVADFPVFEGCLGAPGDYTFYGALDTSLDGAPGDIDLWDFVTVQSAVE
ncbi:MAG TPA: hypothetical protein VM163_00770 [bacterium]|nr:hypothetical protein [bacterium]